MTILLIAAGLLWQSRQPGLPPSMPSAKQSVLSSPSESAVSSLHSLPQTTSSAAQTGQTTVLRSLESASVKRQSVTDAIADVNQLLAKAALRDATAKLSLFEVGSWCIDQKYEFIAQMANRARGVSPNQEQTAQLRQSRAVCDKLPEGLVATRFEHLDGAASAGSIEAMVLFERALHESSQKDPEWLWKNSDKIPELRTRALSLLEQAAALGITEAHVELAGIYATGRYGQQDLPTALAHLLAVQKFDPNNLAIASALIEVRRKMGVEVQ